MDYMDALVRLQPALDSVLGRTTTTIVLDGICELPTRREREIEVCWLAHDYGLLDVIAGEEVNADKTTALVA